jgi:hypothetical protein
MSNEVDLEAANLYHEHMIELVKKKKVKAPYSGWSELSTKEKKPYRKKARAMREATHMHYKGGLYQFLYVAECSDDKGPPLVIYRHVWPDEENNPIGKIWYQDKDVFFGYCDDGVLRYKPIVPWNYDWMKRPVLPVDDNGIPY